MNMAVGSMVRHKLESFCKPVTICAITSLSPRARHTRLLQNGADAC